MNQLLDECCRLLGAGKISSIRLRANADREYVAFEGLTVIGFVFAYSTPEELLAGWRADFEGVARSSRIALISAQAKAWNTYAIFLAANDATYNQKVALSAIEEDLVSARKIARAGVSAPAEMTAALIPLLPIQNAPQLEAVDIAAEIRLRTTELPSEMVEAFLSEASLQIVEQIVEEQS